MTVQPQLTAEASAQRQRLGSETANRLDPVYRLLDAFIFSSFFQPHLPGPTAPPCSIEVPEVLFLLDNLKKHRAILWLNIIVATTLGAIVISTGLELSHAQLWALLASAIAPLIISGIAWYTISFSGVPERFSAHAMLVTGALFLAASMSMTAVLLVLALMLPWSFVVLGIGPLYIAVYVSAVLYDNLDGLRSASFQPVAFSRAQSYLQPTIVPSPAEGPTDADDPRELVFLNSTRRLAHIENELGRRHEPMFANVLIVDGLREFARLLSLTSNPPLFGEDLHELATHAHEMSVEDVNRRAAPCLRVVVEYVHALLGDIVIDDMETIGERLSQIERLRDGPSRGDQRRMQALADFYFIEVFRHLVSVVQAHQAQILQD